MAALSTVGPHMRWR